MVIREVPPRTTPIQLLRELEKRLRVKHHIHIVIFHLRSSIHSKFRNLGNSIPIKQLTKGMSERGSLLDGVPLAETLGTVGVRSPQESSSTVGKRLLFKYLGIPMGVNSCLEYS
ncbi:hypothetical protein KIW84_010117 [Lathyrus oleraceus]|uniref:Uncharacterized protein n=1 Tax=Pisum sativum TaxID=3888 RepID=A0A9D5BDV9_PEA|nr:hypothetical protein KIW84_010117 [Pisum sativum]